MRQNALLRSGKGLVNPGTARKNVAHVAVVASAEERADHFAIRNGVRCAGVHLIVDLHGAEGLDDIDLIDATLRRCVDAAQATLLHIHLHHFQPNGVSGVAVLAESHISIHTWPDMRLRRARRVHVRQGQSRRLHPGAARRRSRPSASRSARSCAGRRLITRAPRRTDRSAWSAGVVRFLVPEHGRKALDPRNAVRRSRLPHDLRGRAGALRDADRAPASRSVRAPVLRQDADARRRHAGHQQGRVRLPRDDDARADLRPRQCARGADRRRRRLRHRRGGAQAQIGQAPHPGRDRRLGGGILQGALSGIHQAGARRPSASSSSSTTA